MAVPVLSPGALSVEAIVAIGDGSSLLVASSVIMSGTPVEKAGSAAAIEESSYELGMALSVAALGSIGMAFDALAVGLQVAALAGAVVLGIAAIAAWRLVGGGRALRAGARARRLRAVG